MGYTTDFYGSFQLDKPLTEPQMAYLKQFAETRRMKRDAAKTALRPDPTREAVGLPIGTDGEFFVGEGGHAGQNSSPDIMQYNDPPSTQPGLWCQWIPNEDGTAIEWDGGEKFYEYKEWLVYLIENFLRPWGYVLNGEVEWQGEDREDRGVLIVENNNAQAKYGRVVYD